MKDHHPPKSIEIKHAREEKRGAARVFPFAKLRGNCVECGDSILGILCMLFFVEI